MYEDSDLSIGTENSIVVFATSNEGDIVADKLSKISSGTQVTIVDIQDGYNAAPNSINTHVWHGGVRELFTSQTFSGEQLLRKVRPVSSTATQYKDWGSCESFYLPEDVESGFVTDPEFGINRVSECIFRYNNTEYTTRGSQIAKENLSIVSGADDGSMIYYPAGSIRFNPSDLRSFYREQFESPETEVSFDSAREIRSVETDSTGILSVETPHETYTADEYDLFVDATGQSQQLLSELNPSTDPPTDTLPFDSILTATHSLEHTEISVPTTLSTTDHGVVRRTDSSTTREWLFAYSSSHIDEQTAEDELSDHIESESGSEPESSVEYVTSHGDIDQIAVTTPWVGNCVAVGSTHTYTLPTSSHRHAQAHSDAQKISRLVKVSGSLAMKTNASVYTESVSLEQENTFGRVYLPLSFVETDTDLWADVREAIDQESFRAYRRYTRDGFAGLQTGGPLHDTLTREPEGVKRVSSHPVEPIRVRVLLSLLGETVDFYENVSYDISKALSNGINDSVPDPKAIRANYLTYDKALTSALLDDPDEHEPGADSSSEESETDGWESF